MANPTTEELLQALVIAVKCSQALNLPYREGCKALTECGFDELNGDVESFISCRQINALKLFEEYSAIPIVCAYPEIQTKPTRIT